MTPTRSRRLQKGLTQEELARRAHLTTGTVAKVDSGRVKHPSSEVLYKLSRALDCTMEDLYVGGTYVGSSEAEFVKE
jgi:transcriptional regulator with XRE-family HTH domain